MEAKKVLQNLHITNKSNQEHNGKKRENCVQPSTFWQEGTKHYNCTMGSVKTFSISSYQNKRAPKIGYDGPVPFFRRENSEGKKRIMVESLQNKLLYTEVCRGHHNTVLHTVQKTFFVP